MELLIMIQTLRLDSAARITAVVPYLCYGRSDKKDQPRADHRAFGRRHARSCRRRSLHDLDPHAGQVQDFLDPQRCVDRLSFAGGAHQSKHAPGYERSGRGFCRPRLCQKGRNYAADMDMPIAFIEKRRHGNDANAEALTPDWRCRGSRCDIRRG
ncbi:MAG: ribose-phosphate pyrophosphokinase-like domain-containing protein [Anaerolineales bacterium]|nr:ribose-phosphate pyrophosphokinase-like domain-containing protein [Anaerolineales bacterium]